MSQQQQHNQYDEDDIKNQPRQRRSPLPSKTELCTASTPKLFKASNAIYRSVVALPRPSHTPLQPSPDKLFSANSIGGSATLMRRRRKIKSGISEKAPVLPTSPDRANSPSSRTSFLTSRPLPYAKQQLEAALRAIDADFQSLPQSSMCGYMCTNIAALTGAKLRFAVEIYSVGSELHKVDFRRLDGDVHQHRDVFGKVKSLSGLCSAVPAFVKTPELLERVAPQLSMQSVSLLFKRLASPFYETQKNAIESLVNISLAATGKVTSTTSSPSQSNGTTSSPTGMIGEIMSRVSPLIASVNVDTDVHRLALCTIVNIAERLMAKSPEVFMELVPRLVKVAARGACKHTQKLAMDLIFKLSKAADASLKHAIKEQAAQLKQCCAISYLAPKTKEVMLNLGCAC